MQTRFHYIYWFKLIILLYNSFKMLYIPMYTNFLIDILKGVRPSSDSCGKIYGIENSSKNF